MESDIEEEVAKQQTSRYTKRLDSTLSSRVASGQVLRRAALRGEYYVEVRVYTTKEAQAAKPEERYKKALVTLKAQLDPEHPEFELLQNFLRNAKNNLFQDAPLTFFDNK